MPLYEVVVLSVGSKQGGPQLKALLKSCATALWAQGAVLADVRPWGQREMAYRIRKQGVNHYHAQYTSLHVYCSPLALRQLEGSLRTSDHVLRWMALRQESTPRLSAEARHPFRPRRSPGTVEFESDPADTARWEYRNLVMQRVFEGRTKQELIAEQLVRYKQLRHEQSRPL